MCVEVAVAAWWHSRGQKVLIRDVENMIADPRYQETFEEFRGSPSRFCEECGIRFGTYEEIAFVVYLVMYAEGITTNETVDTLFEL